MHALASVRAAAITLWAWGLCVGGFWCATGDAILPEELGGSFEMLIGAACVCAGLHVFAKHCARDAFPHAAKCIRRGVQVGSLMAAVGAVSVAVIRVV